MAASVLLKIGAGAFCCTPVVDFLVDKKTAKVLEEANLSDETKRILAQIVGEDSFVTIASLSNPPSIIKANESAPTDVDVKTEEVDLGWKKTGEGYAGAWKEVKVHSVKKRISEDFTLEILAEDDMFTKFSMEERIKARIYNSRIVFPLHDLVGSIDDKTAEGILEELKFTEGEALPVSYSSDFHMLTDESFCRIFFSGMGSVLLVRQDKVSNSEYGPFVVDLPYQDLELRDQDAFRPYGARIHFSKDRTVTAIYDYAEAKLVKPGEDGWALAKMLAKTTAFLLMTVREHLIWTHMLVSNVATRESTLHLPPNHPIRRLLTVFTYGATEINISAYNTLIPRTCILHRSTALMYTSLKDIFEMSYSQSTIFQPFPEQKYNPALQELIDDGKFPYASEGEEYYEIVRRFVINWLDHSGDAANDDQANAFYDAMKTSTKGQTYELPEIGKENAMVDLLSTIIFTVTAYHELVGHVIDYTLLPSRAGFRLTKRDPSRIDLQAFLYTMSIAASTSKRMPALMADFPNFFGEGGAPAWEREVWNTFQADLISQSKKVRNDDADREMEFKYFDPARFEYGRVSTLLIENDDKPWAKILGDTFSWHGLSILHKLPFILKQFLDVIFSYFVLPDAGISTDFTKNDE
eukprot:scaffold2836_cov99-Cylindrotheca_fusiformis.AAC.6